MASSTASPPSPSATPPVAPKGASGADNLSLAEMLRVMDMARSLRDERAAVEREFNADETRALLREKLLASTKVSGDTITSAEVDAAIELYFNNLHTYRDPPLRFEVILAHLYVRRWLLLWSGIGLVVLGTVLWRTVPTMTPAARQARVEAQAASGVEKLLSLCQAEAIEPAAKEQVAQIARELAAARKAGSAGGATSIQPIHDLETRLLQLRRQMSEEYEVHVVAERGRKSGIDRYFQDPKVKDAEKVPSWYAIVEARNPRGQLLTRRIRNSETDKSADVQTWGERIPREVFERLKADKKDGVLNETLFSVKRRGYLNEEVRMPGPDGKPLTSTGQITAW